MNLRDRGYSIASMARYRIKRRVSRKSRLAEVLVRKKLLRHIPSKSKLSGEIWAIAMVKNEVDILESSIRHLFSEGIDAMLIADNGSSDGTRELLLRLSASLPILVVDDPIVAYEQDAKMTALANGARKLGAKWIVPFDADEFWFAEAMPLGEFLRREKNAVVIYGNLFNAFPVSDDEINVKAQLALSKEVAIKKVAFKAHRFASLCMGCNEVYRGIPRRDGIVVLHLPWRSKEQLRRKVSQGKAAVLQSSKADWAGGHWVQHGDSTELDIERIWDRLISWEPVEGLAWNPSGERFLIEGVQNPLVAQ